MVTFGYVKDCIYKDDGVLYIKVRIPSIHGGYFKSDYKGGQIRNYVADSDLPYYMSLALSSLPNEGEIVALASLDSSNNDFIVIGATGGKYKM
jgi:hypothetical protein